MNILEAIKEAFMPRRKAVQKHEEIYRKTEEVMQINLRRLEESAMRGVTESTDLVSEFRREPNK